MGITWKSVLYINQNIISTEYLPNASALAKSSVFLYEIKPKLHEIYRVLWTLMSKKPHKHRNTLQFFSISFYFCFVWTSYDNYFPRYSHFVEHRKLAKYRVFPINKPINGLNLKDRVVHLPKYHHFTEYLPNLSALVKSSVFLYEIKPKLHEIYRVFWTLMSKKPHKHRNTLQFFSISVYFCSVWTTYDNYFPRYSHFVEHRKLAKYRVSDKQTHK